MEHIDKMLHYLIENNQFLVFFLATIIGVICLVWFFFIYRGVKIDVASSATNNIKSLKLKEVLRAKEKELERMKHRFENQQKKIEDLKGSSGDEGELAALKSQVEELKGRLSDYEIIEDDIANLSKYKAQNADLMEKLSKFDPEIAKSIATAEAKEEPAVTKEKVDEEPSSENMEAANASEETPETNKST